MATQVFEENSPSITYTGTWFPVTGPLFHGGRAQNTSFFGASLTFTFQGSEVQFLSAQGWNHGRFSVDLDGVGFTDVDASCCLQDKNGGGVSPQTVLYKMQGLDPLRQHTLTITNGQPGPRGSVLIVDAFTVIPTGASPVTSSVGGSTPVITKPKQPLDAPTTTAFSVSTPTLSRSTQRCSFKRFGIVLLPLLAAILGQI